MPRSNTGTRCLVFNKEITSLESINGLKMRIPGKLGERFLKEQEEFPVNIPEASFIPHYKQGLSMLLSGLALQ
ncbi:MAG: hypothetical protein CM15mP127_12260 [Gammaproteobacteria bacterium]|nr:MAG: hypothetical protein CM15mP127_12260 [Gammaproteobacteria bacterium]